MHEFAIARGLIDAAIDVAREAGIDPITRLHCRIGDLRQVDGWLLNEAFSVAREGTPCAMADLCVERTHMLMDCSACASSFVVSDGDWNCPKCGHCGRDARGGNELDLIGIDGGMGDENRCLAECVSEK